MKQLVEWLDLTAAFLFMLFVTIGIYLFIGFMIASVWNLTLAKCGAQEVTTVQMALAYLLTIITHSVIKATR